MPNKRGLFPFYISIFHSDLPLEIINDNGGDFVYGEVLRLSQQYNVLYNFLPLLPVGKWIG